MTNRERIDRLNAEKHLAHEEWVALLSGYTEDDRLYAREIAAKITEERFGRRVFFRGIIEFSNICKNDCLYCGIRCSNRNVSRYRLTKDEILMCCKEGYRLGYRTFVLQGGEEKYAASEDFLDVVRAIRAHFPDCAITLSVGEFPREVYEAMYEAGANRYLLRHETADADHYASLHPSSMSFENRMRCLRDLKEIGFQAGCGLMVGSPNQTPETLAKDMEFIRSFEPAMVGMGPFIPHKDTPFADRPAGSRELTLFLLSLVRIMLPDVLLPATTALGTVAADGRIEGVLAGCNVVMPNLSPQNVRKNYMLYDNKSGSELSAEESLALLKREMDAIGREVIVGRGDHRAYAKN